MKYMYRKARGYELTDEEPIEIEAETERSAKYQATRYCLEGVLYYASTGQPVARRSLRFDKWFNAEFARGVWWIDGLKEPPLFDIEPTNPLSPL